MSVISKLALGTVQFGLDYGISNQSGQTAKEEVKRILELAHNSCVDLLDTAALYGSSEDVIGCTGLMDKFSVVTKTPHFSNNIITDADVSELERSFFSSVEKLKVKPYGVLIHNADDLLKPEGYKLYEKLKSLKGSGCVVKIGVSAYTPDQCEKIIELYDIDLIQLPMNIYDQRFLNTGMLELLKKKKMEIHVRSVFLQGLLLLDSLPEKFRKIHVVHNDFRSLCEKHGQSRLAVALNFVAGFSQVDRVVVGVNNINQLKQILTSCSSSINIKQSEARRLSVNEESIINPSKW